MMMGSLRLFRLCLLLGSVFMLFLIIIYWDEVGHGGLHLRTSPPAPPPPLPPVPAAPAELRGGGAGGEGERDGGPLLVAAGVAAAAAAAGLRGGGAGGEGEGEGGGDPLLVAAGVAAAAAATTGSVGTGTQLAWTAEDKGYAFIWDTDAFDREVMEDPDPPETKPTRGAEAQARPPQHPVAKPPEVVEVSQLDTQKGYPTKTTTVPPQKESEPEPELEPEPETEPEPDLTPTQAKSTPMAPTCTAATTTTTISTTTTTTTTPQVARLSPTTRPPSQTPPARDSAKPQPTEPQGRGDNDLVAPQPTDPDSIDKVPVPLQATEPNSNTQDISKKPKESTETHSGMDNNESTKPQEAPPESVARDVTMSVNPRPPVPPSNNIMMSVRPQSVPPTPPDFGLLKRQAERRRHLQQACAPDSGLLFLGKDRSFDQIPSQALDHLIVDDRHGVIYCYVPKVACTNWKRVMIVLGQKLVAPSNTDPNAAEPPPPTPYRRPQDVPSELSHNGTLHLTFNKFWRRYGKASRNLMHAKLRKYTKFLFVRDPFVRLMSAFRNKFAQPNEDFYRQFGTRMLKRYANVTRPLPATAKEAFKAGLRPSFTDFVHYLLDPETEKEEAFNEHWRQVYRLCHPCQIHYDFVGKLETLEEDAQHLLRILDVEREIQFPPGYRNRTAASWEHDWFANVPLEDRRKLYELYEPDFRLFGYPKPDTLLHE